ncbi:mannose-1-phosphate guanylyltransferase/phosphomannomutase [Streptomyces sp. SAI-163]
MKAVVMAGGEGTRLRPMTSSMPKPLLPVVNRPIMEHVLRLLKRHGLNETVVTVQFLASLVKNYFGDGEELGMELTYANEEKPLGTAGSVKNAEEALKDDAFLVISGDALTDFDLTDLINFHKEKGSLVTVCLTRVPNPLEFGITIVDEEGKVERFLEKPTWGQVFSDTVNTGIYVMEPEVFDYVDPDVPVDWSGDVFPQLMKEGKPIYGYVAEGYWEDVGTHESYVKAQADVLERKVDVDIDGFEISPGVWVAEGAEVHPDAVLRGPLYVGDYAKVEAGAEIREHTVIGSNVVVKSGAFLHKAVVADNVYVGPHSNLRGCVVGKNTDIMRAARIEDGAVIGDECLVGEESIIQGNVRVYPFKTIEAGAFVNTSVIWESRGQAHLFGARGVSGILNVEITPELAVRLAGAYATTLKKGSTVTTARDHSRGARALKRAVISALQASAIDVRDLENVPLPVARQQTARGSAGGIMIRTTLGVPDSVDIMFFDGQGADLSQGSQRKLDRVFARQEYRRAFPGEIGDLHFPSSVFDSYTGSLLRNVDITGIAESGLKVVVDASNGSAGLVLPSLLGKLGVDSLTINPRSRRGQAHRVGRHAAVGSGAPRGDRGVLAGGVRCALRPGRRAAVARRREGPHHRGRPGAACDARPDRGRAAQRPGGAPGDDHQDRRAGRRVPRHAGRVDDHLPGRPDPGRRRGRGDLRRRRQGRLHRPGVQQRLRRHGGLRAADRAGRPYAAHAEPDRRADSAGPCPQA